MSRSFIGLWRDGTGRTGVLVRRVEIGGTEKWALRVFPHFEACRVALGAAGHAEDDRWQAVEVSGETVLSFFVWQDPAKEDSPTLVSLESAPELAMYVTPAEFVESLPD